MNDIKVAEWQQWSIELGDFHDAGTDLRAVQRFHIGFGDPTNDMTPGGDGIVYFDDIELCRSPTGLELAMKFTPQALNPGSRGKWVKAHFVLPEGYAVEDVDANEPAVLEPGGIESDHINVFVNVAGFVEIEAAFGRSRFCSIVPSDEFMDVTVFGSFTDGQDFYGTGTIKITTNNVKFVGVLALHWLEGECGRPNWCHGLDLDQDSVVDFKDFALFDGCCIEVAEE
jgi:hypothetical protein